MSDDISKRISVAASCDLIDICKPLNDLHIETLGYTRFFPDGSEIILTNNPILTEHFHQQNYSIEEDIKKGYLSSKLRYFIWPQTDEIPTLSGARNIAGMFRGISILLDKNEDGSYDSFGFGLSNQSNHRFNSVLNHIDLLIRFCHYFIHQAAPIIERCKQHKFVPTKVFLNKDNELINMRDELLVKNFINNTKIEGCDNKKLRLSAREHDCINHLVVGKTAPEIAEALHISTRTVETHLERIKEKLNCHSKSELLAYLYKHWGHW